MLTRLKIYLRSSVTKHNVALLLILMFYLASRMVFLEKYPVWYSDESMLSNCAYNLLNNGNLGYTLYEGWHGLEERNYFMLPLPMILLAGSFKLFGMGVLQSRMVSVILGLLCVVFTYLVAKRLYSKNVGLLAALLLSVDNLFFMTSRWRGVEPAAILFILISLYCFLVAVDRKEAARKKHNLFFVISGLALGFGLLSHQLALLGVASLCVLFLYKYKLRFFMERGFWLFSLAVLLPLIPYIIYILSDYSSFAAQYFSSRFDQAPAPFYYEWQRWAKIANLIKGKFVSLVILAGVWAALVRWRKGDKIVLLVILTYLVLFAFFIKRPFATTYVAYYAPYYNILLAGFIVSLGTVIVSRGREYFRAKARIRLAGSLLLLSMIVLLGGSFIYANTKDNANRLVAAKDFDYESSVAEIESYIKSDDHENITIVGVDTYWMGLRGYKYYDWFLIPYMMRDYNMSFDEVINQLNPDVFLMDWGIEGAVSSPNKLISTTMEALNGTREFLSSKGVHVGTVNYGYHKYYYDMFTRVTIYRIFSYVDSYEDDRWELDAYQALDTVWRDAEKGTLRLGDTANSDFTYNCGAVVYKFDADSLEPVNLAVRCFGDENRLMKGYVSTDEKEWTEIFDNKGGWQAFSIDLTRYVGESPVFYIKLEGGGRTDTRAGKWGGVIEELGVNNAYPSAIEVPVEKLHTRYVDNYMDDRWELDAYQALDNVWRDAEDSVLRLGKIREADQTRYGAVVYRFDVELPWPIEFAIRCFGDEHRLMQGYVSTDGEEWTEIFDNKEGWQTFNIDLTRYVGDNPVFYIKLEGGGREAFESSAGGVIMWLKVNAYPSATELPVEKLHTGYEDDYEDDRWELDAYQALDNVWRDAEQGTLRLGDTANSDFIYNYGAVVYRFDVVLSGPIEFIIRCFGDENRLMKGYVSTNGEEWTEIFDNKEGWQTFNIDLTRYVGESPVFYIGVEGSGRIDTRAGQWGGVVEQLRVNAPIHKD